MIKLNQKGFAITVMLYSVLGLVLMIMLLALSTMSGSRKNNSDLVDHIKDDLNNATYDKTVNYTYTGRPEEFTVTKEGYYKIDLWGASGSQGSSTTISGTAGKGAYTSGTIYLKAGQKLYFYVGQQGIGGCDNYLNCTTLAFNGGGLGGYFISPRPYRYPSGGGATDVRLVNSTWNDLNSLKSRIMVAAGGGSGDIINTGSNGGTLIGEAGNPKGSGAVAGGGGTQTSGGTSGRNAGSFGIGGEGYIPYSNLADCNDSYGGGGGYYGGGGGVSGDPTNNPRVNGVCAIRGYGGGGSSYISGYAGSNSVGSTSGLNHTNDPLHYSGKYFVGGTMTAAVNDGNGKASIRFMGTELTRKTDKLLNVRYVKDCINGSTVNVWNHWVELQAIQNGVNVARNKIVTGTASVSRATYITDGILSSSSSQYGELPAGQQCIILDLLEARDLDEVAVWHFFDDKRSYNAHTMSVSTDGKTWTPLISNTSGVTETPTGTHVNAY